MHEASRHQLSRFRGSAPLRVAIVYEDAEMARRGKELCDFLAAEAGVKEEAQLSVWRFDFFDSAALTHAASVQVEEADVVIFAVRGSQSLPTSVQMWLEDWPARRKIGHGALIVLFADQASPKLKSSNVGLLLLRAAARARMDFFCASAPKTAPTRLIPGWENAAQALTRFGAN